MSEKKVLAACLISLSLISISSSLYAGQVVVTTDKYDTAEQMLLANEMNESGEPFAEALGYDLDMLDPFLPNVPDAKAYVLGIENYEYSRYQLGTIITRSGMGLHLMWGPIVVKLAAMEAPGFDGSLTGTPNGFNEDDELVKMSQMFTWITNQPAPGNPWPQFADFISGDPHLPQAVDPVNFGWADFSTLRWDRSKMQKLLNPSAMGQSLMKQYLWASDMLSGFHDKDDNGIEPDGMVSPDFPNSPLFDPDNNVYFGGDSLDGYIGMIITAESVNKVAFLTHALAYDGKSLGPINLATYHPTNGLQYFPHTIKVKEAKVHPMLPPRASSLAVGDDRSFLFDQASMLWGTASFTNMMDPNNDSDPAHLAYHDVFDGQPFRAAKSQTGVPGPYDLMKATSKVIFMNLMAMHFNQQHKTFVDMAGVNSKTVFQGNRISTVNAAYLIVALETMLPEFAATPLKNKIRKAVRTQAKYIVMKMGNAAGGFAESRELGSNNPVKASSVSGQAAAIRALYAAYRVTGQEKFMDAADAGYAFLLKHYYVAGETAFRTTINDDEARYTAKNFALIAGALRDATLTGGFEEASDIYTAFFQKVGNKMQLAEKGHSGEVGNDSDNDGIPFVPEQPDRLPPVFASEATLSFTPGK